MDSPSALNLVDRFLGAFNLFLFPVAANCKVASKTLLLAACDDACHEGQKCVFVTTKGNHQLDKMCSRGLSQEVCGAVKTSLTGAGSKDARASFLAGASLKLGADLCSLTSDRNLPTSVRALCSVLGQQDKHFSLCHLEPPTSLLSLPAHQSVKRLAVPSCSDGGKRRCASSSSQPRSASNSQPQSALNISTSTALTSSSSLPLLTPDRLHFSGILLPSSPVYTPLYFPPM